MPAFVSAAPWLVKLFLLCTNFSRLPIGPIEWKWIFKLFFSFFFLPCQHYSLQTALEDILYTVKWILKQKWQWLAYTEEPLVIPGTADFIFCPTTPLGFNEIGCTSRCVCLTEFLSTIMDQSSLYQWEDGTCDKVGENTPFVPIVRFTIVSPKVVACRHRQVCLFFSHYLKLRVTCHLH